MNKQEILNEIHKEIEKEKLDYKGLHCCLTIDSELSNPGTLLKYNQYYREYGIKLPESTGCILLDYCMACGKKLPKSLRHEWYDILKQEYNLESPMEEDEKKVPAEFLTDEWWKKRGL